MSIAILEDFGPAVVLDTAKDEDEAEAEEKKLAIFEDGYAAGWDDAITAQSDNSSIASEELSKNMKDLSFTYNEALNHIQLSILPVLQAIVDKVLPPTFESNTKQHVIARLHDVMSEYGHIHVTLKCSNFRQTFFETVVADVVEMPIQIKTDPSYSKDEVSLHFESREELIDLSDVHSLISQELDAVSFTVKEDITLGSE